MFTRTALLSLGQQCLNNALMNRVPTQVFDRLKSLGLLKNRRTSRAGHTVRLRRLNSAKKIESWTPSNTRHYTRCIWPNERGHFPENCIQVLPETQSKTSIPSLLLSNVCHLSNKVDELQGVAEINNVSIAIVTESLLTSETPSSSISVGEYNIYRKDRNNRQGGGVVVYVKNYLRSKRLSDLESEDKEVLWLKLFPPRLPRPFSCILVAGLYFPPGKTAKEEKDMIDYLTNCTDAVLKDNPSAAS